MKRRIYLNIATISILVAIFTAIFLVFTFYNFYVEQAKQSLKDNSNILSNSLEILGDENPAIIFNNKNTNLRITIINPNGKVTFDSIQSFSEMESHMDRPEVQEALTNGNGESVRYSTTIGKDTYYYASLLSSGSILRVSRQTDNILSVFMRIVPTVFLIIFLILFLLLFISSKLTKRILKPIEEVSDNIEKIISGKEVENIKVYDELSPFINTVTRQSEEINLNIKALKEKADIMETITSNMKEGVILLDSTKHILSSNNSGIDLLGGNKDSSYYGEIFLKLCRNIEINKIIDDALVAGVNNEITIRAMDRYLSIYINPVFSNEYIIGVVLFLVDSTEKHKAELMRREFSANVSHELKTPLTSINGYAEMIENGMVKGEDITKFATIIRKEGTRLFELIDSIIRLSKLDESSDYKEFEAVDIYDVAIDIIDTFEIVAREKNIDIELYGQSLIINADRSMIEELLFNLIDNAIKYSNSNGKIKVEIVKKDSLYAIIKVIDKGIGIPKEDQNRIFERFYMVDKSRSKKTQSTGLGLSIVKHVVEYHNGTIDLISEVEKGTEIKVKLPLKL